MAERSQTDEVMPLTAGGGVWIVLVAVLVLGALLLGITVLHENGLVRTDAELAWDASQSMADADALGFVTTETTVSLNRDFCFGFCPAYTLELYGSGTAQFMGHKYVCEKVPERIRINRADLGRVVAGIIAVDKANGFTYPYPGPNDAPYVTITLHSARQAASVTFPPRYSAHTRVLDDIAARIDSVGDSATWVGEWHDRQRMCRQADGSFRLVPGHW